MRPLLMTRMRQLSLAGVLVLVAASGVALRHPVVLNAFNPQPDPPGTQKFPPLSVTAAMNVRVSVANTKFLAESSERPCAVVLLVFDSDGNVLARERKLLGARQSASIELPGSGIVSARGALQAQVWAAAEASGTARCPTNASFELVDAVTGHTVVALGGPDTIGDPGI